MYVLITLSLGCRFPILPKTCLFLAAPVLVSKKLTASRLASSISGLTDPSRQTLVRHLVPSYRHIRTDFCSLSPSLCSRFGSHKKKGLIAFSGASFALAVWMQ